MTKTSIIRKKKPNKAQRDAKRAEHADIFNKAFTMGFEMGYSQGRRDAEQEFAELLQKERNKAFMYGR